MDLICGIPDSDTGENPHLDENKTREFLTERPKWKQALNINACVGLVIVAFLYGFYR